MKKLIIFCNGWGMDSSIISKLYKDDNYSVLEFNSWHKKKEIPDISKYTEIYLIAWSMGVWASENIFKDINFTKKIAINGTPIGIDNNFGINEKLFFHTLKNFNQNTRDVFFKNMLLPNEHILILPKRDIEDLKEELLYWWENRKNYKENIKWDKTIISKHDNIIPYENQKRYWISKQTDIIEINYGHYIFNKVDDFKFII